MLSHDLIDAWTDIDSPVHRLDARVKLVCATILIGAVLLVPVGRSEILLSYAAILAAVAAASRLPAGWLVKRMAILAPFLVLGTIGVLLLPPAEAADAWQLGGRELSRQAVSVWLSVGGKCILSLLTALILVGATTSADLLRAAQGLHVPRTLTSLLGFAITYIEVLADEAGRMLTAMRSRGQIRGVLRKLRVSAAMLATLMARTVERADRIALAMVSRGYHGRMPTAAEEPAPARQWAVAGIVFAVAVGLTSQCLIQWVCLRLRCSATAGQGA